jgi:Icc-related predicted phosphoesterase
MKILFTSDLHGLVAAYERFSALLQNSAFDIGIISGDLTTGFLPDEFAQLRAETGTSLDDLLDGLQTHKNDAASEYDALVEKASQRQEARYKAILSKAGKFILLIMGNDDGLITKQWGDTDRIKNINLKRVIIKGIGFVGYQYTNPFVGGLFEKTEEQQQKDMIKLSEIVEPNTILVTHGPAFGLYDKTYNMMKNQEVSIGSKALRLLIDQRKPKLHLFGHLHAGFGIHGTEINGSYPVERKFIGIDLNTEKKELIE